MVGLDDGGGVEAWDIEVCLIAARPLLSCDYFLSLVVDVVDGTGQCPTVLVLLVEAESMEGGYLS